MREFIDREGRLCRIDDAPVRLIEYAIDFGDGHKRWSPMPPGTPDYFIRRGAFGIVRAWQESLK